MKYLRYFEKKKSKYYFEELRKGDYVIINCPDYEIDDEVMILGGDPESTPDGFVVGAYPCGTDKHETYHTYYDYEIVKKLTKEEAELYIAAKNYNL